MPQIRHADFGGDRRAPMVEEPLFKDPEHAIKWAYRMESMDIVKVSSYFSGLRGSTLKQRRSTGPWDDHAQAAMILALIDRKVDGAERTAVRAIYTHPTSGMLELRKATDCALLAQHILTLRKLHRYYLLDTVRGWAGYRRAHQDRRWAHSLGVSTTAICEWRQGRAARGWDGIIPILDGLVTQAFARVYHPMCDAGLICGP